MENFNRIQGSGFGLPAVGNGYATKALQSSAKSLGNQGAQANSELVAWYEQAYAYYNAVVSGAEAQPGAQAWQSFLDQMQWAAGQLGYQSPGNSWNPSLGPAGSPGSMGQGLPEGAVLGAMDNVVWNQSEAHLVAQNDPRTQDIWSNEVTLDVTSLSAQVTSEITTDTRLSPPEEVLKIIVKDPATGMESCYFVHDYEDANIEIRSPEEKQIQDASGGLVTWQRYEASTGAGNSHPDASIEGVDQGDGTTVYEPDFAGETVDFWANPNEDGATNTHLVYADANITCRPSDEVTVNKGAEAGMLIVTVKHRDTGGVDVYKIQKGYNLVNINVNASNCTFGGQPATEGIPAAWQDRILGLNGVLSGSTGGSTSPDTMIQSLLETAGLSTDQHGQEQMLNQFKSAGYDFNSIEDVKKAIANGEFPGNPPDEKLFRFLILLDSELRDQYSKNDDREALNERLVSLVQVLYPDHIISTNHVNPAMIGFDIDGESYAVNFPEGNDKPVLQAFSE